MKFSIEEFSRRYFNCLNEIVSVLPKSATIPTCFNDTSFVIACADIRGKTAIDIISRNNLREIQLNGKQISPVSESQPRFIIADKIDSIEQFIFTQDDKGSSISITMSDRNVVLDGLAFSNKEYNKKYWKDAKFYRNCSGSIPFTVTSSGSMLGLDLLWGAELSGKRQERLFEFIKIYGNVDIVPIIENDLRDEVFKDFGHAVPKLGNELDNWSFMDFLQRLEGPVDRNVLLLGSYKSEDDFDILKATLSKLGYNSFLLKDSLDLPIQTSLEKLFTAIICSSFVIVIDKEASGHIAELTTMLQYHFRPVIILREQSRPTTAFLEDRVLTDEFFKVAIIEHISPVNLLPYVKWARDIIDKKIKNLNKINYWRK